VAVAAVVAPVVAPAVVVVVQRVAGARLVPLPMLLLLLPFRCPSCSFVRARVADRRSSRKSRRVSLEQQLIQQD
jgi:hypothetical protein